MAADSCRVAVKERVLKDMLGSVAPGSWKLLVLDPFTTKVLSCALKMSDILDCNVSVVEDLFKNREPLPLDAIYFIQPTQASVTRVIEDFKGPKGLYSSVHIFFSSKVPKEAVDAVKACPLLIRNLKTLKEVNLEFLTVDSRTVVTDHPNAFFRLMGDITDGPAGQEGRREAELELDQISQRIVTLLATMNEMPSIRFRVGKPPDEWDPPGAAFRATLTGRLASKVYDRIEGMQQKGQLPSRETCDLLILDRSYDPVAPVIHEWTYEAMLYDLLGDQLNGNVYSYRKEESGGQAEDKQMTLDERDEVWVELRHMFIADVYKVLGTKFKDFQNKNKAAQMKGGIKDKAGEMSGTAMRALIQALPQYREVLGRLSLHIQISSELRGATNSCKLTDVGELEQDLVLGEKHSKDLISFLADPNNESMLAVTDKMRLLMCYLATHPDKMDPVKKQQWMKVARLGPSDMAAITNLSYLGVQVLKSGETSKTEKAKMFMKGKTKPEKQRNGLRAVRADECFSLFRVDPLLKQVLDDLVAGRLPQDEYPYVKAPQDGASTSLQGEVVQSVRTRGGLNWAKRGEGSAAGSGASSGRRLIVFIIGGAVRSEMRIVHELSRTHNRNIVLASTAIDTPHAFIDNLYKLGSYE